MASCPQDIAMLSFTVMVALVAKDSYQTLQQAANTNRHFTDARRYSLCCYLQDNTCEVY